MQPIGLHSPTLGRPMEEVAPGVVAIEIEHKGSLYYPAVQAMAPRHGDVGRWLDSLPTDRRVVFPSVISGSFEKMLQRRGFVRKAEWSEEFDEWAEIYVRRQR